MANASMKSSIYENKSFTQQYTASPTDEDTANYQRSHKPMTIEKKTRYTFNGNGIYNKTEEHDYTPKPLDLSLNDFSNLGNLVQRIKKHRINPLDGSLSPQFVFITNKKNDFGINNMERFQSYLDLRHYLPITFDSSEDDEQYQYFMDALVRSLIEAYPKSLIQFQLKKSENEFNGLYFTANVEVSSKIAEFLKEECYLSEKEANLSVWRVTTTKDLVSWNSFKKEFAKGEIYFSYNEEEWQSKSLNSVFEHIETKYISEHSSSTHVKSFNAKFTKKTCSHDYKPMEIIQIIKITVQVSDVDRKKIIKCLKDNVLESDVTEICLSQESDGSLPIHEIISEHLKIGSIEEAVKGLAFFSGFEELKNYPPLVWQTAFVMKYLERVLEEQKIEWEDAYEKADKWISEFLQYNNQYKELLCAASEEYLIQQGIVVHNALGKKITVSFEVDNDTKDTICKILGSNVGDENFNEIISSQTNNGSFQCHELISGTSESFSVNLLEDIDTLRNYADTSCLRRLDNSVWITLLVIVYFEIVLANYRSESKWSSAYNNAKTFVQQRVPKYAKYEKELHDACEEYLLGLGYNYLTKNHHLV